MTDKRAQQLIAKAIASSDIDRVKYYHMCWWEGRLRCLHVHHTKDIHPVFFAAPGDTFANALNERQWKLLTDRIVAFAQNRRIGVDGRTQGRNGRMRAARQGLKLTGFDAERLRRLLPGGESTRPSEDAYLERLHRLLETADTVPPEEVPHNVVTMNSQVRLKKARDEIRVALVFPGDEDRDGDFEPMKVSVLTPIGLAILGRRVGDSVEGRVRIQDLLYQPEAAGHFDR